MKRSQAFCSDAKAKDTDTNILKDIYCKYLQNVCSHTGAAPPPNGFRVLFEELLETKR